MGEKIKQLPQEFPRLFPGPPRCGMGCGDGWYPLIRNLCGIIMEFDPGPDFRVEQIKEKFGGLRFYVSGASSAISTAIGAAEDESFKICEDCGAPGKLRGGSWMRTLCDEHGAGKPVLDEDDGVNQAG